MGDMKQDAPHTTDKVGEALAREVLAQAYERANLTCPAADVRSGNKIDWVRENVALDAIRAALASSRAEGEGWLPKVGDAIHVIADMLPASYREDWRDVTGFIAALKFSPNMPGNLDVTISEVWPPRSNGDYVDGFGIDSLCPRHHDSGVVGSPVQPEGTDGERDKQRCCGEHDGRDPDTFNMAVDAGYTTVSHDSDTDSGNVYLTDVGRAFLAATPATNTVTPDRFGEGYRAGVEASAKVPQHVREIIGAAAGSSIAMALAEASDRIRALQPATGGEA